MQLSPRLNAMATLLPKDVRVADIGTDHAYLPIFLAMRGTHPAVIATELSAGPFARAFSCVCEHGIEDRVELRLGDGLAVVKPGEVDAVVMAGMGGGTMVDILTRGIAHLPFLKVMVLQPMSGQEKLRQWLDSHGWHPAREDLVLDDGKFYEIIAAEPGQDDSWQMLRHRIGPRLLDGPHPLLAPYLTEQKNHWEKIANQVEQSRSGDKEERLTAINSRIQELKEVLGWLSPSGIS